MGATGTIQFGSRNCRISTYCINSFVGTNKLPQVHFSIDADFPIAAFMSIGFSHHYAIVSKVKDPEQRKFYLQFAADTKAKVEDLEQLIDGDLYHHQGELPNNFKKTIPNQLQAYRGFVVLQSRVGMSCLRRTQRRTFQNCLSRTAGRVFACFGWRGSQTERKSLYRNHSLQECQ